MTILLRIAIVQNVPINDHRMVYTDGIARELSRKGYDIEVIIQNRPVQPPLEGLPYRIISVPGGTYSVHGQMRYGLTLINYLLKNRFDIIHAKNPFSSIIPPLVSRRIGARAKLIYDIRGLWIDFAVHERLIPEILKRSLTSIDVFCMNCSDRVIAISHELRNILVGRGVNPEKITVVVGDGVDLERIGQLKKQSVKELSGMEGKVVGYVGSIGKSRSSEKIIESLSIVNEQLNKKARLVMIGPFSRSESSFFHKLVKGRKIKNHVFFVGQVSHDLALSYMKSFDLAVSYHEGDLPIFNVAVPTKILEYLASGCAIVTTNQKMYRNILTHGYDSYLTEQDPEKFAEGIIRVIEDEEFSKRISHNAMITARKYSIEKVASQIADIYEKVSIE